MTISIPHIALFIGAGLLLLKKNPQIPVTSKETLVASALATAQSVQRAMGPASQAKILSFLDKHKKPDMVSGSFFDTLTGRGGETYDVYKNPSSSELQTALERAKQQSVRGLVMGDDIYFWDSYLATHDDVIRTLDMSDSDLIHIELRRVSTRKIDMEVDHLDEWPPVDWKTHPYFEDRPKLWAAVEQSLEQAASKDPLTKMLGSQPWKICKEYHAAYVDDYNRHGRQTMSTAELLTELEFKTNPSAATEKILAGLERMTPFEVLHFKADCLELALPVFEREFHGYPHVRALIDYIRRFANERGAAVPSASPRWIAAAAKDVMGLSHAGQSPEIKAFMEAVACASLTGDDPYVKFSFGPDAHSVDNQMLAALRDVKQHSLALRQHQLAELEERFAQRPISKDTRFALSKQRALIEKESAVIEILARKLRPRT